MIITREMIMATIKSFTDLSQSKVLSKMLSDESADMHYPLNIDFMEHESVPTVTEEDNHFELFPSDIPCWSLSALLNYLKSKNKFPEIKELSDGRFKLTTYIWDGKNNIQVSIADNLVDACYWMILKLHALNLL